MEPCGRDSVPESSQPDAPVDLRSPGDETGLEEPMWQLGLGGDDSYPDRPCEPDCAFYLRTGFCGYGSHCRFNHPPLPNSAVGGGRPERGEHTDRIGQPVCKFYMRTGSCKFGTSCRYYHLTQGGGHISPVPVNYFGYPLRPGEKDCSNYLRTGECGFGVSCKFHHPQPSMVQEPYGHAMLTPDMVSVPGWSPYQALSGRVASHSTQPNAGATPFYGRTQLSPSAPAFTGGTQKEHMFPERPGQPECQYYMKTGDCKFGSSCRYHHPPEWNVQMTDCAFSPVGLPVRPGAPLCAYYILHGTCKFGRKCKFDHLTRATCYSPSASSPPDIPVAPYPVASSTVALAPSSASSDLQTELVSGTKDSSLTRMPSSAMSTSSGLVGSISSKSGPVPHFGVPTV